MQLVIELRTLSLALFFIVQLYICDADYLIRTRKVRVLKVSIIMTPAYAQRSGNNYYGFLPELLAKLKERKGIQMDYNFAEATNNELGQLGHRLENGTVGWGPGLINDVMNAKEEEPVLGAGPILNTGPHIHYVAPSLSWAPVWLTIVVHRNSSVRNLQQFIQQNLSPSIVSNSFDSRELERVSIDQKDDMALLNSRLKHADTYYHSVEDGLWAVARRHIGGLVLNSEDARYYTTHKYCDSCVVIDPIVPLGHFVFVFKRDSLDLDVLNTAIKAMADDGSLEALRNKELGVLGTCNKARDTIKATAWVLIVTAVTMDKLTTILF